VVMRGPLPGGPASGSSLRRPAPHNGARGERGDQGVRGPETA
jgi:hypothetical protein